MVQDDLGLRQPETPYTWRQIGKYAALGITLAGLALGAARGFLNIYQSNRFSGLSESYQKVLKDAQTGTEINSPWYPKSGASDLLESIADFYHTETGDLLYPNTARFKPATDAMISNLNTILTGNYASNKMHPIPPVK